MARSAEPAVGSRRGKDIGVWWCDEKSRRRIRPEGRFLLSEHGCTSAVDYAEMMSSSLRPVYPSETFTDVLSGLSSSGRGR